MHYYCESKLRRPAASLMRSTPFRSVLWIRVWVRSGRIFFFGRTFDLVSQNSINYACVVKVRHTPNARAYVAVSVLCSIMPNPTPTTPTNFRIAQELQFQHADCTSKVHKKCPAVLYASSFFSHPHWPNITACCFAFYSK